MQRFERRDGQWRIRIRVCAFDRRRTDRVEGEGGFAAGYVRGLRGHDVVVYRIVDS